MTDSKRLLAVDVFRGLIIAAMILVNYPASWENTYPVLLHAKWNGISPPDFIFPFFIFIVGVSVALSYFKQISEGKAKKVVVKKILIRGLKLYITGFLLHYLPYLDFNKIDLFGVLQRISIVFTCTALLFLFTKPITQAYIFAGILLIYWVTLSFIPAGEIAAGTFDPGHNFAAWFDRLFFSESMLGRHGWNSEGLYSTLPAIATGISGMLAGQLIVREKINERTLIWLFTAGAICVVAGSVWNYWFPINKNLWTSSYVLFTTGWASITLAASIWFIDFLGLSENILTRFAVIFGSNAILVYVMADVFQTIYLQTHFDNFVYNGLISSGMEARNASLAWALFSVMSCFIVAYILNRKKIFIKM